LRKKVPRIESGVMLVVSFAARDERVESGRNEPRRNMMHKVMLLQEECHIWKCLDQCGELNIKQL